MPETPEARMATFRHLIELYARANVDELASLMAPDYRGHTAAGDRDWPEFRQSILNFHQIFEYWPESFIIEDQFAHGEKVATRMTAHVRNRETGEPMTMMGINLAVIRDGLIHEEWNTWELLPSAASGNGSSSDNGSLSVRGASRPE